jgi:hypothetical protein
VAGGDRNLYGWLFRSATSAAGCLTIVCHHGHCARGRAGKHHRCTCPLYRKCLLVCRLYLTPLPSLPSFTLGIPRFGPARCEFGSLGATTLFGEPLSPYRLSLMAPSFFFSFTLGSPGFSAYLLQASLAPQVRLHHTSAITNIVRYRLYRPCPFCTSQPGLHSLLACLASQVRVPHTRAITHAPRPFVRFLLLPPSMPHVWAYAR